MVNTYYPNDAIIPGVCGLCGKKLVYMGGETDIIDTTPNPTMVVKYYSHCWDCYKYDSPDPGAVSSGQTRYELVESGRGQYGEVLCPKCGSAVRELNSGTEISVKSVNINEDNNE